MGNSPSSSPPPPPPPPPSPSSLTSTISTYLTPISDELTAFYSSSLYLLNNNRKLLKSSLKQGFNEITSLPLTYTSIGLITYTTSFLLTKYFLTCLTGVARIGNSNKYIGLAAGIANIAIASNTSYFAANQAIVTANQRLNKNETLHYTPISPTWPILLSNTLFSCFIYRFVFGSRFTNVLPSNIYYPGVFQSRSIPCSSGSEYANKVEKRQINYIGRVFGCHSCGRKKSKPYWVADHQPPNKFYIKNSHNFNEIKQRFYPHCIPCSSIQSNAVRSNFRTLVFPRSIHRSDFLYSLFPSFLLFHPTNLMLTQCYKESLKSKYRK